MAGGSSDSNSRDLEQTPTWAVSAVVAIIIIISIALEKLLHKLGMWFTERRKKALYEALEKVKDELMILGFISLLLTFGQTYIAKICIPIKVANTMLPCALKTKATESDRRRLLWDDPFLDSSLQRRALAAAGATTKCKAIRGWKQWEMETQSLDYEFSNDPQRFRFAHETSFVRLHISFWNRIPILFYIVSFFRQFFRSVRKADYLAMRHGFIVVHLAPGTKFNFQKYIKRSLEDDFKVIVGISPPLWASLVIFLLLNVKGWQTLFWVSILPLVIILAVGTKLQAIITRMALEIHERHAVVQGIPLVQVSDKHFWFGRPELVLFLIHFTLFQNAFEIIYFLWTWYEFGLKSCFHDNLRLIIARVALGVGALFLCSYITLPLYALVSQMGSNMKRSVFDEQTSKALKKWHQAVKKKHGKSARSPTRSLGMSPLVSPNASPLHSLQRFKTTGHSTATPRRGYYSDQDVSDMEGDHSPTSQTAVLIPETPTHSVESGSGDQEHHVEEHRNEDDFSFVKTAPSAGRTV